ncbi:serine hydrolase domain-containing protein [Cryobacterium tagatosivorans]|nr:serine hydrolase domain-containing protein [Cryobacterium tagatosivorans]
MILGASLAFSGCVNETRSAPDLTVPPGSRLPAGVTERLDAALADGLALSGSSGALAGVWAPWAGDWVATPGTTTMTGDTPMTPDMRFRIGTNTTSMTCTVLLRLVEDGRVRLDDLVSRYLSRSAEVEGITLGQLCRNTSGLADYYRALSPQFVDNPTRQWPPMEILASGLAGKRLSAPGGAWSQSSTGIILLGMALQSATRQDWGSLYRRYIFEPLGLAQTSFPSSDDVRLPDPHPHGYAAAVDAAGLPSCDQLRDETELSNSMGWVAGGVVSTLADLRTWARAFAEGSVLSEASTDAQWATVPQGGTSPLWQRYGLGGQQLGPLRGQAGAIPGFLSATLVDPASGLTIAVVLNNSTAGSAFVQALAQRLAGIAAKAPATEAAEAPAIRLPWSAEQAAEAMRAGAACQAATVAAG